MASLLRKPASWAAEGTVFILMSCCRLLGAALLGIGFHLLRISRAFLCCRSRLLSLTFASNTVRAAAGILIRFVFLVTLASTLALLDLITGLCAQIPLRAGINFGNRNLESNEYGKPSLYHYSNESYTTSIPIGFHTAQVYLGPSKKFAKKRNTT